MTDPQADLTERARVFLRERLGERWEPYPPVHGMYDAIAAFTREAAAAEMELHWEIEAGEAYERGVQSGMKLCEAAAAEARRVTGAAREWADARRAAINECTPSTVDRLAKAEEDLAATVRALASPPSPQGDAVTVTVSNDQSVCVIFDRVTKNVQCVCDARETATQFIRDNPRRDQLYFECWAVWITNARDE